MKEILLSQLRSKDLTRSEFRRIAHLIGLVLAAEVLQHLKVNDTVIKTPFGSANGCVLSSNQVLVPILRSGMALLSPFLQFFPDAAVGFVGLRRDEVTAIPKLYYKNLPPIAAHDEVIVLDPMIATGGSGIKALTILEEAGVKARTIIYVSIIAAPEGIAALKSAFPLLTIIGPHIDERLNDKRFIVPGLGDFGDRYFGTL